MYITNVLILLVLSITLGLGDYCQRLAPVYTSFECKPSCKNQYGYTKFNCKQSPYLTKYSQTQCFFNQTYYDVGSPLPGEYPGIRDGLMCNFTCRNSTGSGPYFQPINCVDRPEVPTDKGCLYNVLLYAYSFNQFRGPTFRPNQRCPDSWSLINPTGLVSDDCSANEKSCCRYLNYTLKINREFVAGSRKCKCSCPPLVECEFM